MEYLYVVCLVLCGRCLQWVRCVVGWCALWAWCGVYCVCVWWSVLVCVLCVGGVVAGGRESCKCVVAQRDQSVIKKTKRSVR